MQQDYAQAVAWFSKAADGGNTEAAMTLAYMYQFGQGVAKDDTEVARWYRKAADRGNAKAESALASLYENGQGVSQDNAEAAAWYAKAADQGDADAQYILGEMYAEGKGVSQDLVHAQMLFDLAVNGPPDATYHDMAANARELIAAKMTPEQIAEAERLAKERAAKADLPH